MPFNRSHIFCFTTKGIFWLLLLGCLNLFLTVKLTGLPKINDAFPSQVEQHEVLVTNTTSLVNLSRVTHVLPGRFLFKHLNLSRGRLDQSRNFRIFDHVITGRQYESLSAEYDVTLVSQSTLNKLHWITKVSETWSGPISLTLFVPDVEFEYTAGFLAHLMQCDQVLKQKLAVHLFFPVNYTPKASTDLMLKKRFNCSTNVSKLMAAYFESTDLSDEAFQKWRTSYAYPQNLARNVGRKNSNTRYTFVTDIDIVPSIQSAHQVSKFLATAKCQKCAYVVATYELDASADFPRDKTELVKYVHENLARPFHHTVFKLNQFATNSTEFERAQNDTQLHISHSVTNYEFFYEPFYISLDTAPQYDERFVGYGFTRNTQVYEMHLAGWTFEVLSPIFAIHWGLQKKRGRPAWRERQNTKNRMRFTQFKKELFARYDVQQPSPSGQSKIHAKT